MEEKFSNLYEDILHEWGEGDFLAEGDMEADREAGIKWVDDPNWKKLHDMDPKMVKDFLKHKEVVEGKSPHPKGSKKYKAHIQLIILFEHPMPWFIH